jgi:hypothetical protein
MAPFVTSNPGWCGTSWSTLRLTGGLLEEEGRRCCKRKKLSMGHKEGTEKKVPGHSIYVFFLAGREGAMSTLQSYFFTIRQLRKKFLLVAFFFFGYVRWIKNLFLVL